MSAVSQSYPNYLGGLNEQPDELKKPGQLVEALNVIPDPVLGLSRRPGFENLKPNGLGRVQDIHPEGTWFETETNTLLAIDDYIYMGCVDNVYGEIHVWNQDGTGQHVVYLDDSIIPHKNYEYYYECYYKETDDDIEVRKDSAAGFTFAKRLFIVRDDNNKLLQHYEAQPYLGDANIPEGLPYFKHNKENPLKYCVSKQHIVFSNTEKVPTLAGADKPSNYEEKKYYSFINLKVIDTENYNYTFTRFYKSSNVDSYTYISRIGIENVIDVDRDYDTDLSLPLQTEGPFTYTITPKDGGEPADIQVTFRGQVVQLKSDDGDGFRNEARYTYFPTIITPGKGFKKNEIYEVTQPGIAGLPNLKIRFKIEDVRQTTATENVIVNPEVTNDMSATEILANLKEEFENVGIDKVVVVGNGLYLENAIEFSVSTDEIAVADVINSQKLEDDVVPIARVNTVAELPVECYDGFIVQVVNSFDGQNDYYLEYNAESNSKDDVDLTKADGYWEEIAKPFERDNPNNFSLPHMVTMVRDPFRGRVSFIVSKIAYEHRTAGTAKDNPSMFIDEAPITEVNYYKNRLIMLTKSGTVITSKAGEINNLFLKTAIRTSLDDPIDIIANSNQRVALYGSAVVNNGMVVFGESEQYTVTTANDVLTTETANVTKIANYTFDRTSHPIYLGTNLGFISAGFKRMYEMTNVYDRGPVDINERSQQIQTQFGQGFNIPVSSREQSQVIVYKRYVDKGSPDMMVYRFRQENSQESSQSAWYRWRIGKLGDDYQICYVSMPRDDVLVFVRKAGKIYLYKMNSTTIINTNNPTLELPIPKYTDGWTEDTSGDKFTTKISFPTIYPRRGELSDITANTTIHRVKFSTAMIGAYNLEIKRKGYETYDILYEQTPADEYNANIIPLYGEHIETAPIYTRNKNLTLTMYTDFDAPLTLRSMTWEGDWNPPYYKRV